MDRGSKNRLKKKCNVFEDLIHDRSEWRLELRNMADLNMVETRL